MVYQFITWNWISTCSWPHTRPVPDSLLSRLACFWDAFMKLNQRPHLTPSTVRRPGPGTIPWRPCVCRLISSERTVLHRSALITIPSTIWIFIGSKSLIDAGDKPTTLPKKKKAVFELENLKSRTNFTDLFKWFISCKRNSFSCIYTKHLGTAYMPAIYYTTQIVTRTSDQRQ